MKCLFLFPVFLYYLILESTLDENRRIRLGLVHEKSEKSKANIEINEKLADPNEFLLERQPPFTFRSSNVPLVVFVFHTKHSILTKLQLHLIRKLAVNLCAIEVFLDGPISKEMTKVSTLYRAEIQSAPTELHEPNATAFGRNANIINWALSTKGKQYLGRGNAILFLDGDVFPVSHFDSQTLLNGRDLVCRKYPATFARFCWSGLLCFAPQFFEKIQHFNASLTIHGGELYDAGRPTIQHFLAFGNPSFSWMKETILYKNDRSLFWGVFSSDIQWIESHFDHCDKCGPEIFISPFNGSDAIFYHMISGTSEWRFQHQFSRRKLLHDSFMNSPYGLNATINLKNEFLFQQLTKFVQKIKQMELVPFHGNLSCKSICKKNILLKNASFIQ